MMPERDTVRVRMTPEAVEEAERAALRGLRWRDAIVAIWGLAGVVGGLAFFVNPDAVSESVIGRNLSGPWDEVWSAAWLVGGLLIVYGTMRPSRLAELFGWCIFAPAVTVYVVAVIVVATPPAAFIAAGVAGGGFARIVYYLVYAPSEVEVRVERRDGTSGPYAGVERRRTEGP